MTHKQRIPEESTILKHITRFRVYAALLLVFSALILTSCGDNSSAQNDALPKFDYIKTPDMTEVLDEPPADGTELKAADEAVARSVEQYYGTDRWALAALDSQITPSCLNCVLGTNIDQVNTPHTFNLLSEVISRIGDSTNSPKREYDRTRPFAEARVTPWGVNSDKTCLGDDYGNSIVGDGSYPSGHSAMEYAMALIMSTVDPDNATEILQRGRELSESRVFCNVHWYSDIQAGREVAAAAVATLMSDSKFSAEIGVVREEFKKAKSRALEENIVPTKNWQLDNPADSDTINMVNELLKGFTCAKEDDVLDAFE